jgi:hypothetical protein
MNTGRFTHLRDDQCAYEKTIHESTEPLGYQMFPGKFENCNKCVRDKESFWRPFDEEIVDTESELRGITRRASNCPSKKYNPGCNKSSGMCTSTFDKSNPVVYPGRLCPIVSPDLYQIEGPGYKLKTEPFCEYKIKK